MVRIKAKHEYGNTYGYWADVTERIRAIMGPLVKEAYAKVFEADPELEPYAMQNALAEMERSLSARHEKPYLACDAMTVVVTLMDGHTFSFTNSEWGYVEACDPPIFD